MLYGAYFYVTMLCMHLASYLWSLSVWRLSFMSWCCMGWLQLVGSFKLQVSFAEYTLFYRALLQKRPIVSRSLLIEATPYVHLTSYPSVCIWPRIYRHSVYEAYLLCHDVVCAFDLIFIWYLNARQKSSSQVVWCLPHHLAQLSW